MLTIVTVKASGPNVENCFNFEVANHYKLYILYYMLVLWRNGVKFCIRVIEIRGYRPTGAIRIKIKVVR
jgi:hypothetical protein